LRVSREQSNRSEANKTSTSICIEQSLTTSVRKASLNWWRWLLPDSIGTDDAQRHGPSPFGGGNTAAQQPRLNMFRGGESSPKHDKVLRRGIDARASDQHLGTTLKEIPFWAEIRYRRRSSGQLLLLLRHV
jgi:hypothetical protein